ncbi:MAG TPA: hypothetical protein VGX21_01905 [Methylomirabilota bacterium]|jgi:hypothetical protein|nr:hypothetical protein [Methylomirabilota bacterium]
MTEIEDEPAGSADDLGAALEGLPTELAHTLVRLAVENQRDAFDDVVGTRHLPRARMERLWALIRRAVG